MTNRIRSALLLAAAVCAACSDADEPVECVAERWLVIARAEAPGCPERAAEVVTCGWQPEAGELVWQGASEGGAADGAMVESACEYTVWLEPAP
jgi:hypothetical protein